MAKITVPFLDLAAINRRQQAALDAAAARVIDSGWYILGREVTHFEQQFAHYCGVHHCIGTASGLDALVLILRAAMEMGELSAGDEVVVPANTYIATVLAVTNAGLTPVLAEADGTHHTLTAAAAEQAADTASRVRAVLTVHLYGQLAEMEELQALCRRRGWLLFEDAAQAAGAQTATNKRAGALSDAAAFSFYPGKNLGALGDGGAVTTDNDALAAAVRALRNYGSERKYENRYLGVNSRLDELQAALLTEKLPLLDGDNARRRAIATRYRDNISHADITVPQAAEESAHIWHLFVVRCRHRDALQQHLQDCGIQTLIHYPIPPHRQRAYRNTALAAQHFPIAEQLAAEVLSLPISPVLSDAQADEVIAAVNRFSP